MTGQAGRASSGAIAHRIGIPCRRRMRLSADRTADIACLAVALDLHHGSTPLDAAAGPVSGRSPLRPSAAQSPPRIWPRPWLIEPESTHAIAPPVTFRTGDISDLPDPANRYDAVHARVVVHPVPQPGKALHGFHRVLKPRGRLLRAFLRPLADLRSILAVTPGTGVCRARTHGARKLETLLREGGSARPQRRG